MFGHFQGAIVVKDVGDELVGSFSGGGNNNEAETSATGDIREGGGATF